MEITVNTKFLYNLRPEKIVIIAALYLLVILIIAPINIHNTLNLSSVAYIVLCLIGFVFGTKLIKCNRIAGYVVKVDRRRIKRIYDATFVLGLIGIVLKYIDLLVLRDMSFYNLSQDNFTLADEGSGNFFSILSALLIFFAYVPFTLDFICLKLHTKGRKIISMLLLIMTAIASLLVGSRFAIIVPLIYMIIIILYSGIVKLSFKWIIAGCIVSLIIFTIVGTLFLNRLNDMNISVARVLISTTGGYSDKVPLTNEFAKFMERNEDNILFPCIFAYTNITQYSAHAIFEFPIVKDYVDYREDIFYGSATFNVLYKFILKVLNLNVNISDLLMDHDARPGIWSTFFFFWYLDFRWFGVFFMVIFGFLCKKVWYAVYRKGNILYIPLICFLSIVIFFVLQLNFIAGSGTYALVSFILLPIIFRNHTRKYNLCKSVVEL